ncbi:unnamed protein product [Rhizoctonia solani]|uniref:Uncharacterized protein n=1 Tax=Rhizoctonia solani TaxID=456999 RepID=A0A8H3E102_9AGAM|nr:unnamed protein product [Rhizoctonia solani]
MAALALERTGLGSETVPHDGIKVGAGLGVMHSLGATPSTPQWGIDAISPVWPVRLLASTTTTTEWPIDDTLDDPHQRLDTSAENAADVHWQPTVSSPTGLLTIRHICRPTSRRSVRPPGTRLLDFPSP